MEVGMRENGLMIKEQAMEFIITLMVAFIKEISRMANGMGKVVLKK